MRAMSKLVEVKVPDIGDFKNIPIIEILVKPGDNVQPEDPLIALESDKATMDVPSPAAGVIKELKVKVGDKVSEGTLVLTLEETAAAQAPATKPAPAGTPSPQTSPASGRGSAESTPAPAGVRATAAEPAPSSLPAAEGPGVRETPVDHE